MLSRVKPRIIIEIGENDFMIGLHKNGRFTKRYTYSFIIAVKHSLWILDNELWRVDTSSHHIQ